MTCQSCGREAEDGQAAHWVGCEKAQVSAPAEQDVCDHEGCTNPKREWSGKGPKPRYCAAGHKKEK